MRQVVLYIKDNDGNYQQTEMFSDETITVTSKLQDVRDISKVFTDFSQPFTIPASKENNKILQHWYNFNIDVTYDPDTKELLTGFDNRIKRDALLEIDYSPYKTGKIDLQSVDLRDGKPFSYKLIFYGNTVNLGDLMGDDELKTLIQLDTNYNHDYNASDIRTAVRNGKFSQSIIYPLISHTKRFYYDSLNSLPQFSGNLYHNNSAPSDNQGLAWTDVKPAIKCLNVIEAIENKYNIAFTRNFFGSTTFSNLYLWLSRNEGPIGGEDDGVVKSRIIGDWTRTSGYTGFTVSGSVWSFSTNRFTNTFTGQLDVTTSSTEPYTLKAIDLLSGTTISEADGLVGDQTLSVEEIFTNTRQIRFILESTASISFSSTLEITEYIYDTDTTNVAYYSAPTISSTEQIIITDNVPQMKNIDFLTGLFKMFNLTAYYIDDISDANYGKIYVDTLDNYYEAAGQNPSGGSYDISKYIDVANSSIDSPTIYSGIDFQYEEPSTLLSINHQEQFNDIFGNEKVRIEIDKGDVYEVKAPFEHMKYERIFDTNKSSTSPYHTGTADTYLTDILWGYSAAGEFNGDFNPKVQGAATNTLSSKLKDTNQEFNNKVEVGDVVRNLTDNTSARVTAVDSSDTLSLSQNIMASGESYMILGDYDQGNYEAVLTKPLVFYGIQETGLSNTKCINWISDGSNALVQYFRPSNTNQDSSTTVPPSYTINFDNEVDEWNLTDYSTLTPPQKTNSLFKKFYQSYIEDLFDVQKRMIKVKARLSMEVIINLRLNDRLIINNQVYIINSIKTNLKTELSELELLNVVNNYIPTYQP